MEISFSTAQNGLFTSNRRQNTIAHNLSNLTTDGFKAHRVDQSTIEGPGTRMLGILRDFSQGAPQETGVPTHLFVAGEGFFQVERGGEPAYTRLGSFRIDLDGNLVTPSGHLLDPNIVVPEDSLGIVVRSDGLVASVDPDGKQVNIGAIELVSFVNPAGLIELGDNLYAASGVSGDPQTGIPGDPGIGTLQQGFLEQSNVDPSTEISQQIINQRYYQLNLRVFQTTDAAIGRAIDLFS